MSKIKGVKIILVSTVTAGEDPFGKPVEVPAEIEVDNVLIAPVTSDDIISNTNLEGKKAVYKLAIPKGDANNWTDREVIFFGQRWQTVGTPLRGIDHLIPLDWNKQVMVARYE